jgi:hypothetical protein
VVEPGTLIRRTRQAAAVSRLERGELSPTFETFAALLAAMGETFAVEVRRETGNFDRGHLCDLLARTPAERLELAISWNLMAGQIPLAGAPRAGRERRVSRRTTPLDARRIFEALAGHDVEYVLIGGLAVQAHGHTRTTQGVDLVPGMLRPTWPGWPPLSSR